MILDGVCLYCDDLDIHCFQLISCGLVHAVVCDDSVDFVESRDEGEGSFVDLA